MKQRFRLTFIIATITVICIVLFQIYWLYYNFDNAQRSFRITAVHALEKSIDRYQSLQVELPTSLNYKKPSLTVFMRTKPSVEAFDLDTPKRKKVFDAEFHTVAIDKQHEPYVRALIARLLTQQEHKPLDLEALKSIYVKELCKDDIVMPVTLSLRKNPLNVSPDEVATRIDFYKSPVVIAARLDSSGWMLRHNLLPAVVSLILILLAAGSLWYIGVIIKRQLKLDRLKNDFISNITHELRTPLTILRSSNEAIAKFAVATKPERLARYTSINSDIIDKLESEVDRIMDISIIDSRSGTARTEKVDLHELLKNVIQRFELIGGNRVDLNLPDRQVMVNTDPYKIETILNNLLDNANKYAGDKSTITVGVVINSANWQLIVNDNGQGISREDLPYIFDKYYRADNGDLHDVKGYGLGLSHVRALVESLKGNITVKSDIGQGTKFIINFPVS
ncbi:HAMP domain-containing histidine kinase [Mucilaginibacter achroorhodeus]|uniref:histidine kinase n=1 Tax=Mucilaginibacter achroorhodeus TaxID=2599294 RepID=A0A563U011_9SPHI|nr:HAMP domain-containing sensor histidine kinase [Mucilaginibacter achroorhodeus]TWR24985.1 HAMP domain-containing histidine kinase [Mucilaginibacter achroorhodeus]